MIHPAPDYPATPERDADDVFEQHRDDEREGATPLGVERRSPKKERRPLADRRDLGPGGGPPPQASAARPEVAFAGGGVVSQPLAIQFSGCVTPTTSDLRDLTGRAGRIYIEFFTPPRRRAVVTTQDGVTREVWRDA